MGTNAEIRVCICGDMAVIERASSLFSQSDPNPIFGDLLPRMKDADLLVANLEAPLFDQPTPANKEGRVIGAPVSCLNGICATGFHALGLANNHILDHGTAGLASTLRECAARDVGTFGAGSNLKEAGAPWSVEVQGRRVAFIGMSEDEFCLATEDTPGAFPFDAMNLWETLPDIVDSHDYVVALAHSGREMHPYPTPDQQRFSRFLIDRGVTAIIHQHSHTPGCYEIYNGGLIVYGQGNFVFDSSRKRRNGVLWHRGFLVHLNLGDQHTPVEVTPFAQFDGAPGLKRLQDKERDSFLTELDSRNQVARDPEAVRAHWEAFCESYRDHYLSILHGTPKPLRDLTKASRILRLRYMGKPRLRAFNYIRRQTHREVLKTLLKSGDF